MSDVDRAIAALREHLAAGDPAALGDVGGLYELRFVGDERRFHLALREGDVELRAASGEVAPSRLGLHAEDLLDLIAGRVTLAALFQSGRLRVFTDIGQAMRLERLF